MQNIACFGCSFTSGLDNGNNVRQCWPYKLSIKRPDVTIYNFGKQASSVLFSINMIEQAKRQLMFDTIISQITLPYRMTFYSEYFSLDIKKHLIQVTDNYYILDYDLKEIISINGIVGKREKKEMMNNHVEKFDRYQILEKLLLLQDDNNHFIPEYRSHVNRIKDLSNISFFHKDHQINCQELNDIECIEKILGVENFVKFIIDKGYHFGEEGSDWISSWLLGKIN